MARDKLPQWGRAALYMLLAFLITSCGSKTEERTHQFDENFAPYVAAFTSETISRSSPIQVHLASDVVESDEIGSYLADSPFEFSPSVEGRARWISTRAIEFEPQEVLASDQYYKASFDLKRFLPDIAEKLATFPFTFETIQQTFEVSTYGSQANDDQNLKKVTVKGLVRTADFEYAEKVEQLLKASQGKRDLEFEWAHDSDGKAHWFNILSVDRKEDPGEIEIEFDGDPINVDRDGKLAVAIPALGDFQVLRAETQNSPEQMIRVSFSDPLKKGQNLDGLVRIEGLDLRYVIDGNELRVFPRSQANGELILSIEPGIRNSMGHKMQSRKEFTVQFEEPKPQVRFVGNGNILPHQGSTLPLTFEAVSLKAVEITVTRIFQDNILQFLQVNHLDGGSELYRVGKEIHRSEIRLDKDPRTKLKSWNRHSLDLSKLIAPEPGAIYRVNIDFDQQHSTYTCEQEAEADNEEDEYYYYRWQHRDDPCHEAYYNYNDRSVSRNVLASELGLIAKGGTNGAYTFAVNDLHTTEPLSGVELEVYDFQQQLMTSLSTDGDGLARFESEETPFVLVAKRGNERGYLKMQDGLALSLSKFDISGKRYHQGVKGYIYGERGVWRPGDTIFTTFMLEDKLGTLPKDHPVTFVLTNPRGQRVKKEIKNTHVNGVYTFQAVTDESDITGNYLLRVEVGGASFEQTIKVETVMPNRLKIGFDMEEEFLTEGKSQQAQLDVRWLHGATARNLNADVMVNLKAASTKFKSYSSYHFDDPVRKFESEMQQVFEGQLDENGKADVPLDLSANGEAPGMLRAHFVTKVFEPGGNFSVDRFNIPYYPYDKFVGVKVLRPEKDRYYLDASKTQNARIVAVSPDGKALGSETVTVDLYRVNWRWWWDRNSDELTNYNGRFYRDKVETRKIKLSKGVGSYAFKIEDGGRFLLRVTHPDGHITGEIFYAYHSWWTPSTDEAPGGATMLTFQSDKTDYKVGETVELKIPMSAGSRALVSIESGSQVLKTAWVDAAGGQSTSFKFPATSEMAPNVYAHVTLIQPHAQTTNDRPMRLYGVVPIKVTDPKTRIQPVVYTPKTWRPMENAALTVSEAQGKGMTYTVAVVDEGLLDLTRFRTPDPWNEFYAREALDVKTWDLYDQVAGAYGADLTKLLGIGGDAGLAPKEGTKVNRFRPVVKFFGPFELKPGQKKSHRFKMPNYVGSVRTMVVARQGSAYGSVEKATPVRKPVMTLATLPRVLGPGEEVKLPVTIFAMEKNVKNVTVTLTASDIFEVKGGRQRKLQFTRPGDQLTHFDLAVKKKVGTGTVKVVAQAGAEVSVYEIDIEVRNSNPRVSEVEEYAVKNGERWEKTITYPGMKGTNHGILEISRIPPINLGERAQYLIRYPHGCIEQTTSGVLAQLNLDELIPLSQAQKKEIETNVKAGIDRIVTKFQTADGGLSYWPGRPESHPWGTNYGGKFIVEAKLKGYNIPRKFYNDWLSYQQKNARRWYKRYDGDDLIQADRLYLLALVGKPELGAMNRLQEKGGLSLVAQWRLAAAYQLAGQPEMARTIGKDLGSTVGAYRELGHTFGAPTRDESLILECMAILNQRSRGMGIAKKISKTLSSGRYLSTHETGYALLAMSRYSGYSQDKSMKFQFRMNGGEWQTVDTKKPIFKIEWDAKGKPDFKVEVKGLSESILNIRTVAQGIPITDKRLEAQNGLRMDVTYTDLDGNQIDVSELEQGTDFVAEVTIENPGQNGDLDELALTQIFASGWEIHNSRLDGIDWGSDVAQPEYQDIRDDRIYTYFDLGDGHSRGWWYYYKRREEPTEKTFRVLLNATYLGRFYLPTVYCEAMYDESISARKPGQWVNVVQPGEI